MTRFLVALGLGIVVFGLLWPWISKIGFGRLPGDFVFGEGNARVYLPLATCFIISLVISVVLWFWRR